MQPHIYAAITRSVGRKNDLSSEYDTPIEQGIKRRTGWLMAAIFVVVQVGAQGTRIAVPEDGTI